MTTLKFKPNADRGAWSNTGHTPVDVLVDGVAVGVITKRREWYGNLGHRGVGYTYYDFRPLADDGRAVSGKEAVLASETTRKKAVAAALVTLGHLEAASLSDSDYAKHCAQKLGIEVPS